MTDFRDFEGIDLDLDVPGPALRFAVYLRRVVLAATASLERGPRPTALPCRRRPGRVKCPGRLVVERQDLPPYLNWECPSCGEAGRIENWRGSEYDLSPPSPSSNGREAEEVNRTVILPETSYWLLLDVPVLDQDCERLLYRARPVAGGVELSGREADFEELEGYVAFEADRATTKKAQRKWEDVFAMLTGGSPDWLGHSTAVVLEELSNFGLVAAREHVSEMLGRHVATLATSLGITEKSVQHQIDDDNLRELARHMAVELAAEQPGADLFAQPRNIPVPFNSLARLVTALAEAAHVRVENADAVGAHGAMQIVSLLGQVLYDLPGAPRGAVLLPQAALARAARVLEATAQLMRHGASVSPDLPAGSDTGLAAAFTRDADRLRRLLDLHGTPGGPTPHS